MYAWFKKWFLDGWLTEGPQLDATPDLPRYFCVCHSCGALWPHWWSNVTSDELKGEKRRNLGCRKCGTFKMHPAIIPAWKSVWWFYFRGKLVRKVIQKKRLWDPRMPVRAEEPVV